MDDLSNIQTPDTADSSNDSSSTAQTTFESFNDEFDAIGAETPFEQTNVADQQTTSDIDSDDSKDGEVASEEDNQEISTEQDTSKNESENTASEPEVKEEVEDENAWELSKEDDSFIKKHIPLKDRNSVRHAYRDAKTLRSFLNPNSPANLWVENLENKSQMRFQEVQSAMLRKIADEPVNFLQRVYDATATEDGNSQRYADLLKTMVVTNQDYVKDVLEENGLKVVEAGQEDGLVGLNADKLAEILDTEGFGYLKDIYPEDAEKIQQIIDQAKEKQSDSKEVSEENKEVKENPEQLAEQQKQQLEAYNTRKTLFQEVYNENVTSAINTELEKSMGLKVEAKEKGTLMGFLKEAKKALILNGGLEGEDFDNALVQWGENKPAFKTAKDNLIKFVNAGEKQNAVTKAQSLTPFAKAFLQERVKTTPEIAFIDEAMKIISAYLQNQNNGKQEIVGSNTSFNGLKKDKSLTDEFDDIR